MALTNRQAVQLRIGDTNGNLFTDAEIDHFLEAEDNVVDLAVAMALESLAALMGHQPTSKKTDTLNRTYSPEKLLVIAQQIRDRYEDEPATAVAEISQSVFSDEEIITNRVLRLGS